MNKFYRLLSAGFGSGYLPKVPGTWGSLAYIALWLVWTSILGFSGETLLLITSALAIIAVSKTIEALPESEQDDPGFIVIDEWVGMGAALLAIPSDSWLAIGAAFVLFRAFDIVKPGPIRSAEKLPGSIGIIADDLLAGIVTNLIIRAFL
jgi:phosphatidylglycerophosphatase A